MLNVSARSCRQPHRLALQRHQLAQPGARRAIGSRTPERRAPGGALSGDSGSPPSLRLADPLPLAAEKDDLLIDAPGLGIELDPVAVARYRAG